MDISPQATDTPNARPTRHYGPVQSPGIHAEGDGFTVVCECRWVRWSTTESGARGTEAEHLKKCKGAPAAKSSPAPVRRSKTDWNGREGSTWIDQL